MTTNRPYRGILTAYLAGAAIVALCALAGALAS